MIALIMCRSEPMKNLPVLFAATVSEALKKMQQYMQNSHREKDIILFVIQCADKGGQAVIPVLSAGQK